MPDRQGRAISYADPLAEALERDFELLRKKRKSRRFLERMTWRPRRAHVLELARWALAIIPLVVWWGFMEGLYFANGDGARDLEFRGLQLSAFACVVLVILGGRRARARLRRSDCIQLGASLGVAFAAAIPSVAGWEFLRDLLIAVPLIGLSEPGRFGEVILWATFMLGWFVPVGIATVCAFDAVRRFRTVRSSRVNWRDSLCVLIGLLAAMLPGMFLFVVNRGQEV